MSTAPNSIALPDGSLKRSKLTIKEAKYVARRLNNAPDESQADSARKAGFPEWMCRAPGREIEAGAVGEILRELETSLVEHALANGLIDAAEIHEYLTDGIRADIRDIWNDDGSFKPRSEWPDIWGRLCEGGDVDVEELFERSQDGVDGEKRGGWDQSGLLKKTKLRFSSRVKLLELAMKHKGVDAMVQQKQGDTNILIVTADQARKVSSARKRLERLLPDKVSDKASNSE